LGVLVKRQSADIVRLWQRAVAHRDRLGSAFGLFVQGIMRRHGAGDAKAKETKKDIRGRRDVKSSMLDFLYLFIFFFLLAGDTKMQTQPADNSAGSNCVLCLLSG
jgi:hypothetical protein